MIIHFTEVSQTLRETLPAHFTRVLRASEDLGLINTFACLHHQEPVAVHMAKTVGLVAAWKRFRQGANTPGQELEQRQRQGQRTRQCQGDKSSQ